MAIYLVNVSHDLIVEADSLLEAEQVALESWTKEQSEPFVYSPQIINRIAEAPAIWLDCYPWGGDGVETVREILERTQRQGHGK